MTRLLQTATIDGRDISSWLVDGKLHVTSSDAPHALRLTLDEADAVATFLRTSIDRALLHGARKEAP